MKRIALLGCGTVGRRIAELLVRDRARLAAQIGSDIQLAHVLVRDAQRPRGIDGLPLTDRFETILEDRSIDLAIEVLGGAEPAATHIQRLLERGVSVVSANKTMLAHHGDRLRAAAARGGATLAAEASVCAAVPVLAALQALRGDRVQRIRGVVNGTSNFILSRIAREGCGQAAAVREAQARGFAEADPAADLSGRDAAEKLCILAQAIGLRCLPGQVEQRGIGQVGPADARQARQWGFAIVPLAEIGEGAARVAPTLLPRRHPLAGLVDAENAVEIESELGGPLLLRGQGAGPNPTASAIIGDVAATLRGRTSASQPEPGRVVAGRERNGAWFVRIAAAGLALSPQALIEAFAQHGIGIAQVEWRREAAFILTHAAAESDVARAIQACGAHDPSQSLLADVWSDEPAGQEAMEPHAVIEVIGAPAERHCAGAA